MSPVPHFYISQQMSRLFLYFPSASLIFTQRNVTVVMSWGWVFPGEANTWGKNLWGWVTCFTWVLAGGGGRRREWGKGWEDSDTLPPPAAAQPTLSEELLRVEALRASPRCWWGDVLWCLGKGGLTFICPGLKEEWTKEIEWLFQDSLMVD